MLQFLSPIKLSQLNEFSIDFLAVLSQVSDPIITHDILELYTFDSKKR